MTGLLMSRIGAPPGAELEYDYDVERLGYYFESRAPDALPAPPPWPAPDTSRFRVAGLGLPDGPERPAVANVLFADLDGDEKPEVVACDMNHGLVLGGDPRRPERGLSVLARVPHPAHATLVDLDGDGARDLLVADLGSIPPGDHENGSVVWLRRGEDGRYEPRTLVSGLPRVADVQAADLDSDGDLDLVVAAFGWRAVGATLTFENTAPPGATPSFARVGEDPRAGSIHVPSADLDGDGQPDVVVLIAQHHEVVEAMLNRGEHRFERRTIYRAPHPAWGSSGIALADMDRDGDIDVVLSAGDMLDDYLLKPWHGLQWLENRGGFPFEPHPMAALNGVHGAIAADLDGDGDVDIAASAFVQRGGSGAEDLVSDLPSLVWLEHLPDGRFERHTLEIGGQHVTLDAGDYDGDGDTDLVTGSFRTPNETWVEVWRNGE
jgi:hypothetical protein